MFDGMQFNANAKPELAFRQKPEEYAKSQLIKDLIPIPPEEIFPDILDNDEKVCIKCIGKPKVGNLFKK